MATHSSAHASLQALTCERARPLVTRRIRKACSTICCSCAHGGTSRWWQGPSALSRSSGIFPLPPPCGQHDDRMGVDCSGATHSADCDLSSRYCGRRWLTCSWVWPWDVSTRRVGYGADTCIARPRAVPLCTAQRSMRRVRRYYVRDFGSVIV